MILEHAVLQARPGQGDEFPAALSEALQIWHGSYA